MQTVVIAGGAANKDRLTGELLQAVDLWRRRAGDQQLFDAAVERLSESGLGFPRRSDGQVGGDDIPFTFVERGEEIIPADRHENDMQLQVALFQLFIPGQLFIQIVFQRHENVVRRSALGSLINKKEGLAVGG